MYNSEKALKEYELPTTCWLCDSEVKFGVFQNPPEWGGQEEEEYFCSKNKDHYRVTLYGHMDGSTELCEEIKAYPYKISIRDHVTEIRPMFVDYYVPCLKFPERTFFCKDYTLEWIVEKAKKAGFEMRFWTEEEILNFEMIK